MQIARQRLCKQMLWVFGDQVPYLFGFVASPSKFDIYALVPCPNLKGEVASIPIVSFNISEWSGKFGVMLAVLNMGRLFWRLRILYPYSMLNEYTVCSREDDVLLRMAPKYVVRDYSKTTLFESAAKRLPEAHKILVSHRVPHVEMLVKTKDSTQLVAFSPRGDAVRPRDLLELFEMLTHVLEMLVALHRAGWIHNCIRWYSIWQHFQTKNTATKSWFVTNFEFAVPSPQKIPEDRRRVWGEDPPELFVPKGQYTTAVDIWYLGLLIRSSEVIWNDKTEQTAFMNLLMANDPAKRPSASKALMKLRVLKENHPERKTHIHEYLEKTKLNRHADLHEEEQKEEKH